MANWRAGGSEGRPKPKDDWRTPPELYARLDAEFHFGLDAACTLTNRLAPIGLSIEDVDSLAVPWTCHGPIWLNPPYSNVRPWLRKAREAGRAVPVVCLVPADTSTRWWRDLVTRDATEIRFLVGRVRFHAADGSGEHHTTGSGGSTIGPSALVIYAPAGGPPRYTYIETRPRRQQALPLDAEPKVTTFQRTYRPTTSNDEIDTYAKSNSDSDY